MASSSFPPRPPPPLALFAVGPSDIAPHATSFASVTDPRLHRHGWRSPRANVAEPRTPQRKIPVRYRALLRYDVLSPRPMTTTAFEPWTRMHSHPPRTSEGSSGARRWRPPQFPSSRRPSLDPEAPPIDGDEANPRFTNLDELKWFQHRWLDKHGKNSHLKEYREKMVLLRRWFESLDADGSGEVGVDELEDPLVSVGLARSRDEVKKLIDEVDKDGSGEVTFQEFLHMMTPSKPKRSRQRQPLHKPQSRGSAGRPEPPPAETAASATASAAAVAMERHQKTPSSSPRHPAARAVTAQCSGATTPRDDRRKTAMAPTPTALGATATATTGVGATNPVVKLFEDLQSGKLGDLAIPFPVLITAYRRRMLLNAHMAEDPTTRRLGTSVLQALETTRREAVHHGGGDAGARRNSLQSSPGYFRRYHAQPPESTSGPPTESPTARGVRTAATGGGGSSNSTDAKAPATTETSTRKSAVAPANVEPRRSSTSTSSATTLEYATESERRRSRKPSTSNGKAGIVMEQQTHLPSLGPGHAMAS